MSGDVRPGARRSRAVSNAASVILLDKPRGITSHDAVRSVRRTLDRGVKVGHAGTLDPFATGLLLILIGRATRVQRFLMALTKRYEAVARFGAVSSTGDPEGEIVETGVVPDGDLELPVGVIRQRPPAYSAVKIGGRRAYALARAGAAVQPAEREVEVYRFAERWREGDRRGFEIECSSGTYVRSLIADLGDAYCEQLRRTRIGPFDIADADPERLVALEEALGFLPEVRLDGDDARRAGNGMAVPAAGLAGLESASAPAAGLAGPAAGRGAAAVRLTGPEGLIALAEPAPGEQLRPVVVLRG